MYENELKALKKAGRFRERKIFYDTLDDLASNDYLGLSHNKKQFKKAVKLVNEYETLSSKASMLVNGYHPIHRIFELEMAEQNGFEEGLVVGSGFLANMALIDALVRKGDMLFMDEEYHASGVMASELIKHRVVFFKHNDAGDLEEKLKAYPAKRQIIAVEGVYSMGGDLCKKEIFDIADVYEDWVEETGVKLIAISIDDARNSGKVAPYVNGKGWEYEVYIDSNQDFKRALNVNNVPHTFLVNGKGEIVWQHNSYSEGDEDELYEAVKKLAAGEELNSKK